MDIVTGLSALTQALGIAKSLRDLDRDFDVSEYKIKIADLHSALADAKMTLTDARQALHDKDQAIKDLEAKIEAMQSGEICPLCETGRMKITSSVAHPSFGRFGVQERTLTCQNEQCRHSEKHTYDPRKDKT